MKFASVQGEPAKPISAVRPSERRLDQRQGLGHVLQPLGHRCHLQAVNVRRRS